MAVKRIFVEKRKGFDVEASNLTADIQKSLGLTAVENVRIINRYDISGIDGDDFEKAKKTILSETNADIVYDEVLPEDNAYRIFAMEYLPGQYDQRADSAAQCVQLLTQGERPQVVSAKVIGVKGDITDADSCVKMYSETGCDLVMIGRGSYGNPFIFREIEAKLRGEAYEPPALETKMQVMLEHIRLILELSEKCEELAMHEARKHAAWYMNGYYGSAKFRGRCYQLSSYAEAEALADEFIQLQRSRQASL